MRPDNMPRPVAPEHSEPANWIVEALRSQALEIAREGHKGWGNTMTTAADEIERLRRERFSFVAAITNDARRITFLESLCEHEWKIQDDSFDHEFGTERVVYDECYTCGATRDPTQD